MKNKKIKFYFDENVHALLATLLLAEGLDVCTTLDLKMRGTTDDEQLAIATKEERALLTHNRVDFEQLAKKYFEAGKDHFGIVIARVRSPYELKDRILSLVTSTEGTDLKNSIRYI